jgi:hypothetical protein
VIEARRAQRNFAEGLIAEEVRDLWEDWMRGRISDSTTSNC